MKVSLKTTVAGRSPGHYEVHSVTGGTVTLFDTLGNLFDVPASAVDQVASASSSFFAAPVPETPHIRLEVDDYTEAEARSMYDDYCSAVGGTAFNGDPLPPASEFFEDPVKQKQANAYRVMAAHAIDRIAEATLKNIEEATALDLLGEDLPDDVPSTSESSSSSSSDSSGEVEGDI